MFFKSKIRITPYLIHSFHWLSSSSLLFHVLLLLLSILHIPASASLLPPPSVWIDFNGSCLKPYRKFNVHLSTALPLSMPAASGSGVSVLFIRYGDECDDPFARLVSTLTTPASAADVVANNVFGFNCIREDFDELGDDDDDSLLFKLICPDVMISNSGRAVPCFCYDQTGYDCLTRPVKNIHHHHSFFSRIIFLALMVIHYLSHQSLLLNHLFFNLLMIQH
jgi:hypothetical protein